ncbi:unknown [Clostridium sp. CAG:448]|nr:unknown [Clostridium sp. CAG:448]
MVADAEAFDVLTADVDDEIHIGTEFFRRREMRNRLHHTAVHMEGGADDVLSVAGHGGGYDPDVRVVAVKRTQIVADQRNRIAVVGLIRRAEQIALPVAEHCLDRRRACVNAKKHLISGLIQFPNPA